MAPLGFDRKQTDSEAVRTMSRAGIGKPGRDSKTLEQI